MALIATTHSRGCADMGREDVKWLDIASVDPVFEGALSAETNRAYKGSGI